MLAIGVLEHHIRTGNINRKLLTSEGERCYLELEAEYKQLVLLHVTLIGLSVNALVYP
jgi:hypothetical protein